jgi:hypothetical protein
MEAIYVMATSQQDAVVQHGEAKHLHVLVQTKAFTSLLGM